MMRGFGAACAALTMVATPMPAMAACWNGDETAAATVRELQSVLMVAALRCQAAHNGFMDDYNGFLRANRTTIQQMNDRIKAHFVRGTGPVHGITAYDAFATSLANSHGGDGATVELCAGMSVLAREATLMAGSAEGLLLLAARQGVTLTLPDGACDRAPIMASATPAAAVLAAAAVAVPAAETAMVSPLALPNAVAEGAMRPAAAVQAGYAQATASPR